MKLKFLLIIILLGNASYSFAESTTELVSPFKKDPFDLAIIVEQAKQGKVFKEKFIKSLIRKHWPGVVEYYKIYNDISFFLNNSGQNKQAIIILEEMLSQDNEKAEAHLNLANAYWGIRQKHKARLEYILYVNQTKAKGLNPDDAVAVKRALHKQAIFSKNIENTFQQVHHKIQKVDPLLFINKGDTKPISVLPWLQKKLLVTSEGKLIKVFAYEKNKKLFFLFFIKTQDASGQYKIKLYQFSENSNTTTLIKSFNIDKSIASFIDYHNNNRAYQNFQMSKNTLDFFIYSKGMNKNERYGKTYYQYNLRHQKLIELYTSDIDEPWFEFVNHGDTARVTNDYDAETNTLKYKDKKRNIAHDLFTIKNFEGGFIIGDINWSKNNKYIYFDNRGAKLACIWRYNIETKELSKIVPEHEAEHPYSFHYKGVPHIIYIEGQSITLARPKY